MNFYVRSRFVDRSHVRMRRIVSCSLLLALCSFGPYAGAQNVGPGEQRFNVPVYKGSHNSEVRDESLAEQIDDYNVWQIELDIMDYNGDFKSAGDLCDPASLSRADSLTTLLTKLQAESNPLAHPFTVIYLDMKGMGQDGGCAYTWGSDIKSRLKAAFIGALGQSAIYPSLEFVNVLTDASSWPSYQNLTARKYRWAVIVDWHGYVPSGFSPGPLGCLGLNPYNCFVQDDFFFAATSSSPAPSTVTANTVLVNLAAGCNASPGPTAVTLPPRDNRWLYRGWPSGECSLICSHMDGAYWNYAVKNVGYNFVATNCINYDDTFNGTYGALTHSPDPLFVTTQTGPACPGSNSTCEWGTQTFPFHNLNAALNRASPMVSILLAGGDYALSTNGSPRIIETPLKLRAQPNAVAILR
jgi:hypothetical protein